VVFAVRHAYAAGIYCDESVENTTVETFLRGYRITDSSGAVTFKTIVPGWYSSRFIHIHVDSNAFFVRLGAHLIHHATFFRSDAAQRADHFGFAVPVTRLAGHHQPGGQHLLQLDAVAARGYAPSITLGVQIA
jgi:protocatechuate 3,4-dioxygenase beta subunit